jgi:hypothetical protein
MFVLTVAENLKVKFWISLKWHNIHIKLEGPSSPFQVITCIQTSLETNIKIDDVIKGNDIITHEQQIVGMASSLSHITTFGHPSCWYYQL